LAASATPARLIVENGSEQGTQLELCRTNPCEIGTDPGCALRLTGPGIAARHIVVKALVDTGFGAKGLGTPFTLNARITQAARLADGDVLELGGVRVRYAETHEADKRARPTARQSLGGFRLHRVLGAGGMGTVYEAEQVSLDRVVALKVLSKDLTRDPVFVARFVAEARAAARLHHPNVLQVFDVDHEGDTFCYSMELMHEGSVEDRLKRLGKLEVEDALHVIADAARGLAYAESLRIVHRDIKPDNLMLDQHGTVKIADLGLAMTDEDDISKVIGTPHFMSPEQVRKQPLDHRSDLYSLGCTFYRLLTGGTPFARSSVVEILKAHVKDRPDSASKANPEVPAEVSAMVDRLLAKEPVERYQSANELLEEIELYLRPPARKGLIFGGIATGVLIAGAGLVYGLTRPEGKNTTTTEIVTDETKITALEAELRQARAENARQGVVLDALQHGTSDLALAAALEDMAHTHEGTEAAAAAIVEAGRIRREQQRRDQQLAVRERAIASAVEAMRAGMQQALEAGDYRRAMAAIRPSSVDEEIRDDPRIDRAVATFTAAVHTHSARALAEIEDAFRAAARERDLQATAAALARLDRVLDARTGWPAEAVADRDGLLRFAAQSRQFVASLRDEIRQESLARAWSSYANAMLEPAGVVAAVDRFEFARAASRCEELASSLPAAEVSSHARDLAASLRSAATFLAHFEQAAKQGLLSYTLPVANGDGEAPATFEVVGFRAGEDQPGLRIKTGPTIRPVIEVVPLRDVRGARTATVFSLPEQHASAEHGAFLAWVAIVDSLQAGRAYLASITATDSTTGTGAQSYSGDLETLRTAQQEVAAAHAAWAAALDGEIAAAQLMARAMLALSSKRNMSAANHLDDLLETEPHSLIVSGLGG